MVQPIVDYFDLNKRAKAGIDKYEPLTGDLVPDSCAVLCSDRKSHVVVSGDSNSWIVLGQDLKSRSVLDVKGRAILHCDPIAVGYLKKKKKKKKKKLKLKKSRK